MRLRLTVLFFLTIFGGPVTAEPSQILGHGKLFSNDYLGDGRDRWQSGSYVFSIVQGPAEWDGAVQPFGATREFRFRSAIVTANGRGNRPDRPYAGTLSFGVHSHYGTQKTRATLGFDVTAIGPQTGLSRFQARAHEVFGMNEVRFTDQQLGDRFVFGLTAETAHPWQITQATTARPFVQVQYGPEDSLRIGLDVIMGATFGDDILIRDVTTGHLYQGTQSQGDLGLSFVFGADVATIIESIYLPDADLKTRGRIRAGAHWKTGDQSSFFYGLTYLTPEFDGQDEGQLIGSLTLNFNF